MGREGERKQPFLPFILSLIKIHLFIQDWPDIRHLSLSVLLMLGLIYTSCLKVFTLKVPLKDQGRSRRAEMGQLRELEHKNLYSYIGYSQGTWSFQEWARGSQIRWGSASSSCLPELANTASLHHWQDLCGLFLAEMEFELQEILEGNTYMPSIKCNMGESQERRKGVGKEDIFSSFSITQLYML